MAIAAENRGEAIPKFEHPLYTAKKAEVLRQAGMVGEANELEKPVDEIEAALVANGPGPGVPR